MTVVQDGISNPVNTEINIGGDNQDENSSQKLIPEDADDFAEVSANVEASAVALNDDAEANNNDEDFLKLFRDHDFRRLRKPISTHLVKCLVSKDQRISNTKKVLLLKNKEDLLLSIGLKLCQVMESVCRENG